MKTSESSWRMWLAIFLLFIFTFAFAQLSYGDDLTLKSWYRLVGLSASQQLIFMEGYIIGTYGAALQANWLYGLSQEDTLRIMILDESPAQVMLEVLSWYNRTQRWNAAIYIAVYRRSLDW